jgi:hypothetical protein
VQRHAQQPVASLRTTPMAAGLRRRAASSGCGSAAILEGDALTGEQERPVEILLDERLGPEPLRVGRQGTIARRPALVEEERARGHATASRPATPASSARRR